VTIRSARSFNLDKPESLYETEAINVGTLHPGELRLLEEKLTPVEHELKAEDGMPVDVFDLDIAAQNFTAEEHHCSKGVLDYRGFSGIRSLSNTLNRSMAIQQHSGTTSWLIKKNG